MLKLLLEDGCDPNMMDEYSRAPIHYAMNLLTDDNQIQIVRLLLEHGADSDVKDKYGDTPLHMAARGYKKKYALYNFSMKGSFCIKEVLSAMPFFLHSCCHFFDATEQKIGASGHISQIPNKSLSAPPNWIKSSNIPN